MALDLSLKSNAYSTSSPLDLSVRKLPIPSAGTAMVSFDKKGSKYGTAVKTVSTSSTALRKVRFSEKCGKSESREKLKMTWNLKKRLLALHREASMQERKRTWKDDEPMTSEKDCISPVSRCEYISRDTSPPPATEAGLTVSPAEDSLQACPLPQDPRQWSRLDVNMWLVHMKQTPGLGCVEPDRFPTNGKGLCLMNVNMFLYREPEVGHVLYRDFISRLSRAVIGRQSKNA